MVHFSVWVGSDLNSEDKSYNISLLVSSNMCLLKTYTLISKTIFGGLKWYGKTIFIFINISEIRSFPAQGSVLCEKAPCVFTCAATDTTSLGFIYSL